MVPVNTLEDSQNVELKKAEWGLRTYLSMYYPDLNPQMTLPECRKFATEVTEALGLPLSIEVRDGRGSSQARPEPPNTLHLPKWARNRVVVLHELIHLLMGWYNIEAHGPEFAGMFLEAVTKFLGEDAGLYLHRMYQLYEVKWYESTWN